MKEKEFIVAIELGSSAIRGIAGRRNPDGSVQVEHIAHVTSEDCIHRGVVYNIDKTTNAIRRVREMLEQALQLKVVKAYVGVQGQSLRTIKNFVRETFERVREVTDTDVDNLLDRNYSTNYGDLEILDVITQEYKLDHKEDDDPKGVETRSIEGRFNNVVARSKVKENILKCMRNAGLECADVIISPLALAQRVLSDQERRSGCALVDFGAQTTTVQVYKGGKLRYLATLPLGGRTITHDIASARDIDFAEAETLKVSHGTALIDLSKDTPGAELPITGDRTFPLSLIERICESRMEEILRNVGECIRRSEVSDQLTSGLHFTGGGSRLKDITRAYTACLPQFNKVHLTRPLIGSDELMRCGTGLQGFNFDTLVSLLAQGEEICTQPVEEKKPEPEPEQQQLFDAEGNPIDPNKPSPAPIDDDDDEEEKPKKMDGIKQKLSRVWAKITDTLNEG